MSFYDELDKYGESIAVITEFKSVSYKDLSVMTDHLKLHIKKGHLVFCFCDNNLESLVGYLSFLRAKAPVVLLSNKLHPTFVFNLIDTYKPEYIWVQESDSYIFKNFHLVEKMGDYVLIRADLSTVYSIHEDLAILLTTSGSTGSPKLVRQSYRNITSNAVSIANYLNISSSDRPITSLPMNYTYGLSIINSHFLKGSTIVLTNKSLLERGFWEMLNQHKATTFGGVPYHYEILKKLRFEHMNLPSLKLLTQAGGKLSIELIKDFASICEKKGMQFITMYGQTEATARMSYLPYEFIHSKPGSIGIPIPGGQFWLEDEHGKQITVSNKVGELVYKGENVTMGYAQIYSDLNKPDENLGVLKTGDMAFVDSDGFYYITGRKNRYLKLFGNRVNLDEVEQIIKNAGYDCACTGADDQLKIFVTQAELDDGLISFISNRIGIHHSAFLVIPIEVIPRNDAGKTLYSLLK